MPARRGEWVGPHTSPRLELRQERKVMRAAHVSSLGYGASPSPLTDCAFPDSPSRRLCLNGQKRPLNRQNLSANAHSAKPRVRQCTVCGPPTSGDAQSAECRTQFLAWIEASPFSPANCAFPDSPSRRLCLNGQKRPLNRQNLSANAHSAKPRVRQCTVCAILCPEKHNLHQPMSGEAQSAVRPRPEKHPMPACPVQSAAIQRPDPLQPIPVPPLTCEDMRYS